MDQLPPLDQLSEVPSEHRVEQLPAMDLLGDGD